MKSFLKKILPTRLFIFIRDIFYPEKINVLENRLNNLFLTHYQKIAAPGLYQKIIFKNAEFKVYSKHGGDGILAYIFAKIGTTAHTFVEIGVEDGRECNTANLSLNFGWQGLLIDANEEWIKSAKDFYKEYKAKPVACFITTENVNKLILDNNMSGEVDLLSIDIDGNDYWIWKAINTLNPRVVVLEYNASFGHHSLTQKYNPEHSYAPDKGHPLFYGASLNALVKLSKQKGYILVTCDTFGHDAFFVRADVAKEKFIELGAEEAFYPNPYNLKKFGSIDEQFEQIKHLDSEKIY